MYYTPEVDCAQCFMWPYQPFWSRFRAPIEPKIFPKNFHSLELKFKQRVCNESNDAVKFYGQMVKYGDVLIGTSCSCLRFGRYPL